MVTKAGLMILWLLKQVGKSYRLGAEVPLLIENVGNPYANKDVREWDCSELVQSGLWVAGVDKIGDCPLAQYDGAWKQFEKARQIPLDVARSLPGALVFAQNNPQHPKHIGHVAIVIAKDTIVEARGKDYGVVIGPWRHNFTLAAKVDELYRP